MTAAVEPEVRVLDVVTPYRYRARTAQALPADMLALRVSLAVSAALGRSNQSREQIAVALSVETNEEVTANMLNAYASAGRTSHNIPIHRLLGLCRVLEDWDLLQDIVGLEGVTVLQGPHAQMAELGYVQARLDALRVRREELADETPQWLKDKAATPEQLRKLTRPGSNFNRFKTLGR